MSIENIKVTTTPKYEHSNVLRPTQSSILKILK